MSKITQLANGIKVVSLNNGVKAAQVGVFSGYGSSAEPMDRTGMANLYAKCINVSGKNLVTASTDRSQTTIKSIGRNAATAFDRIAASMASSVNEENLAAAKSATSAELLALDDDWHALSKEYAFKAGFVQQAAGMHPAGFTETYDNATVDDVANVAKSLNRVRGLTVAAIGDVDHDALCKKVDATMGSMWTTNGIPEHSVFTSSAYQHRFDIADHTWATYLRHVPAPGHSKALIFELGRHYLGSFDCRHPNSQHSAINIRRRYGKATWSNVDFINSFYDVVGTNAVMGFTIRTWGQSGGKDKLHDEPAWRMWDYMSMTPRRMKEYELQRSKNAFLTGLGMEMQADPLGYIGKSVLDHGIVRTPANMKQSVKTVTLGAFKEAFNVYLVDGPMSQGAIGCTESIMQPAQMYHRANPKLIV